MHPGVQCPSGRVGPVVSPGQCLVKTSFNLSLLFISS